MPFPWFSALALLGAVAIQPLCAADAPVMPVTIQVHADQPVGELTPIWRFFGYDEANYTYQQDGRQLLGELGCLGTPQVYVRCHHLLTSGDGAYALKWGSTSAYKEDAAGRPVYDWSINDRIFDTYLTNGLKPYVQIGFMPEALSTHPQNYPHHPPVNKMAPPNAGQSYPPRDYEKWGELSYQWAKHCVERYGRAEVAQWYWEVWNEPNSPYWHGSQADYFKLYDYAVAGVRRALPEARVGGPETAGGPGGTFLHDFLEHCARGVNFVNGRHGSPLDFISFHAKGAPSFTNDHVRMGMSHQFQNISEAFAVIAASPEFRHLPIVIGESDPEGCAACREPRDAYRNGTMYSSYTAASFPREYELAAQYGVNLAGALTWAFEFEDQPPFAGFRALAGDGIDLPVLNVFRMFGRMNGRRLAVSSTAGLDARSILASGVRGQPDISAMASLGTNQLCVLVWHYHDDDVPGPAATVSLAVDGLPTGWRQVRLRQFRIDADHSNSYQAWQKLGQPLPLTPAQRELLQRAGQLAEIPLQSTQNVIDGKVRLKFDLPRQGVALWQIEPMD